MIQLFQGPRRLKLLELSSHLGLCHPELSWLYLSRPQKGLTNGRNTEEGILFQGYPERLTGRLSTAWPCSDIPQSEIQSLTLTLNLGHQCDLHVTLTRLQRLLFPSPWGSLPPLLFLTLTLCLRSFLCQYQPSGDFSGPQPFYPGSLAQKAGNHPLT